MALANIIKEVDPPVELTQAQYNSLTTAQKNDGTVYYITDGNGSFQTAATTPAEDTSGGSSNTQAELEKKVEKTNIVNNFVTTQAGYVADARALKSIADNYSSKTDLQNLTNRVTVLEDAAVYHLDENVDISSYDSSSNPYICPHDGYLQIRNNSGQTGCLTLARYNASTGYIIIGGVQGYFAVFARKGTHVYVSNQCNMARFTRINNV